MRMLEKLKRFSRDKRGISLAAGAIIGLIIATAFAMIVGAIILSETYDVAAALDMGTDANETVEAMFDIVWPSLQLLPIQILALVGVAIMGVVALFASRR